MKLKKEASKTNHTEKFLKEKLIFSGRYKESRDLLEVLLEEKQEYCFQEVDSCINEFLKRKVN
ncbi:MAG: hypothetical protein VB095_12755 [Anaerovorax sp.]|nr:hypothetical protein [Anaerovorax sp.]